jgi:hypothetical protein
MWLNFLASRNYSFGGAVRLELWTGALVRKADVLSGNAVAVAKGAEFAEQQSEHSTSQTEHRDGWRHATGSGSAYIGGAIAMSRISPSTPSIMPTAVAAPVSRSTVNNVVPLTSHAVLFNSASAEMSNA